MQKNRRITKRFNLTALGRHAFRLRESRAGDPQDLSFQAKPFGRARRLTGRYTDQKTKSEKAQHFIPPKTNTVKLG
jgi:hypothetical protein